MPKVQVGGTRRSALTSCFSQVFDVNRGRKEQELAAHMLVEVNVDDSKLARGWLVVACLICGACATLRSDDFKNACYALPNRRGEVALSLLDKGVATGRQIRRNVSHVTFAGLARRPLSSVFRCSMSILH